MGPPAPPPGVRRRRASRSRWLFRVGFTVALVLAVLGVYLLVQYLTGAFDQDPGVETTALRAPWAGGWAAAAGP